jgi:hypothetical protein
MRPDRMNKLVRIFVIAIARPLALTAGFVGKPLYRLLFSRLDEHLAREGEAKLAADIPIYLPFLFEDLKGRVVENQGIDPVPPFDYAIVIIETPNLLLRFTRGRDRLALQIAPKSVPNQFHELSTVLAVLEVPGVRRGSISSLSEAGRMLRSHFAVVEHSMSDAEYPHLQLQLKELYAHDRIMVKQHEAELNRRLYD